MSNKHHVDTPTFLPTKRQMVRSGILILLLSLSCGLLLGLLMVNAPHSALALALSNAFVAGGAAVFNVQGGALLALGTGLIWGLGFTMAGAFIYTAWLIYQAMQGHKNHVLEQRMQAFRRAIEGKPLE